VVGWCVYKIKYPLRLAFRAREGQCGGLVGVQDEIAPPSRVSSEGGVVSCRVVGGGGSEVGRDAGVVSRRDLAVKPI
jgi:hypothetical protein